MELMPLGLNSVSFMKSPDEMKKWFESKRMEFEHLPDDES